MVAPKAAQVQGGVGPFRLRPLRPLRPLPPSFTALTTLDVAAVALRDTLAMTLDAVAVCTEEFA
jgi:hypothetical protein